MTTRTATCPSSYTTETYEGKRLQKFVNKGMGKVPPSQGVPWAKG